MSSPEARRILIAGKSPKEVLNRCSTFATVFEGADLPGHSSWTLVVREQRSDWTQLDLPTALALWYVHNLTKFLLDDPAPPRDLVLTSTGEGDWDYWLTRCPLEGHTECLGGATGKGKPFQVDVTLARLFDHAETRVPPLPTRLALLTRGVHAALHDPHNPVPVAGSVHIRLPDLPEQPWEIPAPANLADGFDIDRIQPKGSLAQVFDFLMGRDD